MTTLDSESHPPRPSDHERHDYFRGLGSSPALLARTGRNLWPPHLTTGIPAPRKLFDRLRDDDLVSKWSRQLDKLSTALVGALEGSDWLHFFPVRITFEECAMVTELESSVVLLVGMGEDVAFQDAYSRVIACKSVLFRFGIKTEVEMYRTERHWYGKAPEQEGRSLWADVREHDLDPRFWRRIAEDKSLERYGPINGILNPLIHSSLSYPLVSLCGVVGSMGVHIKLDGSDRVYGLTCRHVAMGIRENIDRDDYVHIPHGKEWDRRDVKTPVRTVETVLGKLGGAYAQALSSTADNFQLVIREYIRTLPDATTLGCSTIGHVVVSPPLSVGHNGYLQDWALVELEEPKDPRVDLGNKVWVGKEAHPWSVGDSVNTPPSSPSRKMGREPVSRDDEFPTDSDGFMALKETIPMSEVLQKSICVAMRGGAKSQLAYGFTSEIPAIIRLEPQTKDNAQLQYSEVARQVVVIPPHLGSSKNTRQQRSFAQPGDSGSVVFDGKGNILGLVGGGATGPGILMDSARHLKPDHDTQACLVCDGPIGHDVAFVNPMEVIVQGVQVRTGRKVTFFKPRGVV